MPSVSIDNIPANGNLAIPSTISVTFRNLSRDCITAEHQPHTSMAVVSAFTIKLTFSRTDRAGDALISVTKGLNTAGTCQITIDNTTSVQPNAVYSITPSVFSNANNNSTLVVTGTTVTGVQTSAGSNTNSNSN